MGIIVSKGKYVAIVAKRRNVNGPSNVRMNEFSDACCTCKRLRWEWLSFHFGDNTNFAIVLAWGGGNI